MITDESKTQRRAVLTACMVTGAGITLAASSTYVIDPAAEDFGLDSSQATLLKFIPSLATILVVFVAGLLGDRLGRRRAITWGTMAMVIGSVITVAAPNVLILLIGMTLMSGGSSMMIVLSLSLLSASTSDPDARAKAFGTLGVVSPFVYLIAPVIAGAFVTWLNWRFVVLLWLAAAALALITTLMLLPKETGNREAGEMLTPILAGIALVMITQVFNAASSDGLLSTTTLIRALLAAGAVVVLWAVHRALRNPSLSFGPMRRRRSVVLLVVTLVIPLASMWYTTYLLFQYLFGLTPVQISLILIPAQIAGMAGAKVGSRVIIRLGLLRAGIIGFLALAASQASFLLVGVDGVVLTAALMVAFSLVTSLVSVVMSNSVMDSAPRSESGTMSSYRAASSRIGSSLASLVLGTVVLATYQTSLDAQSTQAGLDPSQTDEIAQQLIDAQEPGDQTSTSAGTTQEVEQVSEIQQAAMIDALASKAIFGVAVTLTAGLVFVLGMSRRRTEPEEAPADATSAGSPDES